MEKENQILKYISLILLGTVAGFAGGYIAGWLYWMFLQIADGLSGFGGSQGDIFAYYGGWALITSTVGGTVAGFAISVLKIISRHLSAPSKFKISPKLCGLIIGVLVSLLHCLRVIPFIWEGGTKHGAFARPDNVFIAIQVIGLSAVFLWGFMGMFYGSIYQRFRASAKVKKTLKTTLPQG